MRKVNYFGLKEGKVTAKIFNNEKKHIAKKIKYRYNDTAKSSNTVVQDDKELKSIYTKENIEEVKCPNLDEDLLVADEFQSGELRIVEDIVRRKERKTLLQSASTSHYDADTKSIRTRSITTLQMMTSGLFNPKSLFVAKRENALEDIMEARRGIFSTVPKAAPFVARQSLGENSRIVVQAKCIKTLRGLESRRVKKIKSTAQPPKKMPDNYVDTEESIHKDSFTLKQTGVNKERVYSGIFARKGPTAAEICARYSETFK
eukprot:TRINITY_DN13870_c0_g2_i1.p1 TRINITY_DN13870_c0_g2~~TRINITY_DN13870_c0_g2_i1.p1  ORF type:complete len:260 (-),score=68.86 TRINITY_DN13870_c0_g2_i1:150-929(-)